VGFDDTIRRNYSKLVEPISATCKVPERDITLPSMLHLTVLMLDLSEDSRLKKAQSLLQKLRPKLISEYFANGDVYLSFKGLKTF
jgi:hypothetical protein